MSPNGHGEPIEFTERPLFLLVTRLLLMSHCENQHDIVCRLFSQQQAAWDSRKARGPSTTRTFGKWPESTRSGYSASHLRHGR